MRAELQTEVQLTVQGFVTWKGACLPLIEQHGHCMKKYVFGRFCPSNAHLHGRN